MTLFQQNEDNIKIVYYFPDNNGLPKIVGGGGVKIGNNMLVGPQIYNNTSAIGVLGIGFPHSPII